MSITYRALLLLKYICVVLLIKYIQFTVREAHFLGKPHVQMAWDKRIFSYHWLIQWKISLFKQLACHKCIKCLSKVQMLVNEVFSNSVDLFCLWLLSWVTESSWKEKEKLLPLSANSQSQVALLSSVKAGVFCHRVRCWGITKWFFSWHIWNIISCFQLAF